VTLLGEAKREASVRAELHPTCPAKCAIHLEQPKSVDPLALLDDWVVE